MRREDAWNLLRRYVSKEVWLKHAMAVEAIMRALAQHLGEDEARWGLVGLLHDVDFELASVKQHGLLAAQILRGKVDPEVLRAIQSHTFEQSGVAPQSRMENCLIAADAISGLIIASALVMPSKSLGQVRVSTIAKKFRQRDFARRCSRERMRFCERVGIELEKFFEIALKALREVADSLGL
jgi:putative nucleotidyltransferase with HDIG domain